MSKEFSKALKALRKSRNLTQEEFGKFFNITKTGVSYWENGKSEPSLEMIKEIATFFNVSTNTLIGDNHVKVSLPAMESVRTIPIYGDISCGTGGFVDDEIIDYITIPTSVLKSKRADYFVLYASGDSMVNAGINDGDIIIFEKTQTLDNGEIGCFCIDDNFATCKKFSNVNNIIFLLPCNDKYQPIQVDLENGCFRILGRKVLKIGE